MCTQPVPVTAYASAPASKAGAPATQHVAAVPLVSASACSRAFYSRHYVAAHDGGVPLHATAALAVALLHNNRGLPHHGDARCCAPRASYRPPPRVFVKRPRRVQHGARSHTLAVHAGACRQATKSAAQTHEPWSACQLIAASSTAECALPPVTGPHTACFPHAATSCRPQAND
jgi:hypothetical protein